MALNIKSDEAHRLAKALASQQGSTLTDAVTSALSKALESEKAASSGAETLLAEVRTVQELVARLPDRDPRAPDEVLGYDERGLPS